MGWRGYNKVVPDSLNLGVCVYLTGPKLLVRGPSSPLVSSVGHTKRTVATTLNAKCNKCTPSNGTERPPDCPRPPRCYERGRGSPDKEFGPCKIYAHS